MIILNVITAMALLASIIAVLSSSVKKVDLTKYFSATAMVLAASAIVITLYLVPELMSAKTLLDTAGGRIIILLAVIAMSPVLIRRSKQVSMGRIG